MCRSVCSGVEFPPARCMVSLKYLTAASISSSVLRATFTDRFSLTKCRKVLKYGSFSWFCTCVVTVTITRERSGEQSKHDLAIANFWVIPFLTQKSTKSGSLFQSDGQYVGLQEERCDRLTSLIVLSTSRPLGVMSLERQRVYLAL
jgi:hypothetical protein